MCLLNSAEIIYSHHQISSYILCKHIRACLVVFVPFKAGNSVSKEGDMSAKGDITREGDEYLRLMEAGTELTEVVHRSQHARIYRLDSYDTSFVYISWLPSKRQARNRSEFSLRVLIIMHGM